MKKNFLQDVIPANHKRSIRDIPLPQHRAVKKPTPVQDPVQAAEPAREIPRQQPVASLKHLETPSKEPVFDPERFNTPAQSYNEDPVHEEYEEPVMRNNGNSRKPRKKSAAGKIFGAVLLGIVIALVVMVSRTQAKVTIHPKQGTYEVSTSIPLNGGTAIVTKTQLTQEATVTLPATSEQQVERQAMGRIRIINSHAETPQDLVKNTRFQTSDGKIFRINQSITVPGFTSAGPGTLEVDVYADSAGEEYNIGLTQFTIPGFSGMEQFDKIKAESVTTMTGGYIGIKKVVSETAMEEAEDKLREELQSKFGTEAQISDSLVVIPDNSTIQYGELMDTVEGNSITLSLKASVDAYSFQKESLMNHIGQNTITGASATSAFSFEPSNLTYAVDSTNNEIDVLGSTTITWTTDIEDLKSSIAGKRKSEIAGVVNGYDSFEKTSVVLRPFWKVKFPTDTRKINIEIAQ